MPNDRTFAKCFGILSEVFPHQIFCKGEHGQDDVLHDFPACDVLNRATHCFPYSINIQTRIVPRELGLKRPEIQFEILAKHLDECRVEPRFVVVQHHRKTRARAFALKRHRDQDKRCPVLLPAFVRSLPAEKTQGKVKGVGAPFLQGSTCPTIEFDQPCFHFSAGKADKHLIPFQGIHGVETTNIFSLT
ncbi:hypothetical protein D3C73_1087210 [compost metagenome]